MLRHTGRAILHRKNGQPIHASADTLYIFPPHTLPLGSHSFNDLQRIPFSDIDKVILQKGGNSFTRARKSVSLQIPRTDKFYTSQFQAVRNASVYADSLMQPQNLEEAFPHSGVLRQAFPDKHFRLSVGLSVENNRAEEDALEALENSALPDPEDSYGNRLTFDFLDVSWIISVGRS